MLTQESTKRIAKLARLKFTDSELEVFTKQLFSIESLITNLQEAKCIDIEPLTSTYDPGAFLRADEITTANIQEQLFSNVPGTTKELAKEIKCFVVPKVVE